jgi:uncharacterized protein YukE
MRMICVYAFVMRNMEMWMANMNISVPDKLKERMDKLKGSASVNWSRVAAHAFDLEVRSRTLEVTEMAEAIERLRAKREQYEQKVRADGVEAGKTWALQKADWGDIVVVVAMSDDASVNDLYRVLSDQGFGKEDFASLFGREAHQIGLISDEEAQGFVEGVKLVHDEV